MVSINEAGQADRRVPVTRRSSDTCGCLTSILSLSVPTFKNDICFWILLWQMGCVSNINIWSGDHKTFRHAGSSQIVNCNFYHTITLCHFAAFRRQCLVFLCNYVTETYFTDLNNLWTWYTADIKVTRDRSPFEVLSEPRLARAFSCQDGSRSHVNSSEVHATEQTFKSVKTTRFIWTKSLPLLQ